MITKWRRFRRRYAIFARQLHVFNNGPEFNTSVAICGAPISGKEREARDSDVMCLDCHEILQRARENMANALNEAARDYGRMAALFSRRLEDLNAEADHTNRILKGAQ